MIIEIVVGVAVTVLVIYLLWRAFQKSVSFYKENSRGRTTLHVSANCTVKKITVISKEGKGKATRFVRTHVARGEDVEFVFPSSKYPQKLIVECERGVFEYEVG